LVAKGFQWSTAMHFLPVVVKKTQSLLDRWSQLENQPFDSWPWTRRYALDLVGRSFCDISPSVYFFLEYFPYSLYFEYFPHSLYFVFCVLCLY
jgi:hypothetical protein